MERQGKGASGSSLAPKSKKERRDFARERANRAFHCVPNRHTQTLVTANEASVVQNTRAPFPFAICVCTARGNRSDSRIDCMTHRPGFGPVGPARLQSLAPGRFAAFDTTIVSLCPPPASRPVKGASAFGLPPTCFTAGKHLPVAPCFGIALRSRLTAPLRQVRTLPHGHRLLYPAASAWPFAPRLSPLCSWPGRRIGGDVLRLRAAAEVCSSHGLRWRSETISQKRG